MSTLYRVNNVYPCIQGEGCQTGMAMVLLRLQGCGVGCPFCDTKETWMNDETFRVQSPIDAFNADGTASPFWCELYAEQVADYIAAAAYGPRWILLTGGEPAEQDLTDLCDALHERHFKVALETSGTVNGLEFASLDWVCVSPKMNMPGGRSILADVMARADEIKHVVGKWADIDRLDALLIEHDDVLKDNVQICLQPVSQSPKATDLCLKICMSRGWRLSIQTHKFLSLP